MSYRTKVHIAAPAEGLIQRCFRCDAVLTDMRNTAMEGEWKPLWWQPGAFIGRSEHSDGTPTNPTSTFVMDHDATEADELACESQ